MHNLDDIKAEWENLQYHGYAGCFQEFIQKYFTPVYTLDCDFIGWERKFSNTVEE